MNKLRRWWQGRTDGIEKELDRLEAEEVHDLKHADLEDRVSRLEVLAAYWESVREARQEAGV